jgi:60 kDa SS-A/Ro ribonucleoprotein
MPYTAMLRNLGKMSAVGLLRPKTEATANVVRRLVDGASLRKARVHPVQVLMAARTYASGHGFRGALTWGPEPPIVSALDAAFTEAFNYVEPTGKRYYIGLDVSGSMGAEMNGFSNLSVREAAAAMSMSVLRSEANVYVAGFTAAQRHTIYDRRADTGMEMLPFTREWSLSQMVAYVSNLNFGATDCALPMIDALRSKRLVDVFIIYTDNETWAGKTHPMQALQEYREKMGIPAKLIVCAMTSTGFTIADPEDVGSLDVVGFDSAVPALIADFVTDGVQQVGTVEEL